MKTFKFEITVTEDQLEGDEFWEDALADHPTGIPVLTNAIKDALTESNLINQGDREIVKLIVYIEDDT